jgi:predicted CoA-binding protein
MPEGNLLVTLIIGASENTGRYSHRAMVLLNKAGLPAIGLGRKEGMIGHSKILTGFPELSEVHTVTLYLSERFQAEYEEYILNTIKPKRLIFNPGAENWSLFKKAKNQGIDVLNACTLVMISTGQYVTGYENVFSD